MKRAVLLLAVAAILPACGGQGGGLPTPPNPVGNEALVTWEARVDKPLPGAVGDAQSVRTACSGSNVFAVWVDNRDGICVGSGGGIWFNRSTDSGVTWQPSDVRIDRAPGSGHANAAQIAVNGSHVYVVWQDARNGYFDVYLNHSSDSGVTWLAQDLRLDTDTPGAGDSTGPRIAVAGANVYVAWQDTRAFNDYEIRVNRSVDDGVTWLAGDIRISAVAQGSGGQPQIAATGNKAFVVWSDARTGDGQVFINRTSDQGSTWLASDVRLDHTPAGQRAYGPRVVCSGTAVNVVWGSDQSGKSDIFLNRSSDSGATWLAADVRLDHDVPSNGDSYLTDLVCSGASVFAAWIEYRTGSGGVFISRSADNGVTWLPTDLRIDSSPLNGGQFDDVKLRISGSTVIAVWSDTRTDADVYANRSTDGGVTWLPSDFRLDHGGTAFSCIVDLCISGTKAVVAWEDTRNPQRRIYSVSSSDTGATWAGADVAVSHALPAGVDSISHGPQMAVSGNDVYVAWTDYRNAQLDLFFNHSSDRGRTWNASDKKVGSNGTFRVNDVQIAANGSHVFIVWSDERFGQANVFFAASTNSGATFGADVRLNTNTAGAAAAGSPQILAAGDDLFVAWSDRRTGSSTIYCNRSANGGTTWLGSDVRIDHSPTGAGPFRICRNGAKTYAVWVDSRNAIGDVYFNRSTTGGASWDAVDQKLDSIPIGTWYAPEPRIACSGNNVYVAWVGDLSEDIRFNRSVDSGASWLPTDVRLDSAPASTYHTQLEICASSSSVYASWFDNRGGLAHVYVNNSHNGGATWHGDQPVDASPGDTGTYEPKIACHGDDVWVAWFDRRDAHPQIDGDSDIYINHSSNGGDHWNTIDYRVDLGDPAHKQSVQVQLIVDSLGPTLVWQDWRGGTSDIYAGGVEP